VHPTVIDENLHLIDNKNFPSLAMNLCPTTFFPFCKPIRNEPSLKVSSKGSYEPCPADSPSPLYLFPCARPVSIQWVDKYLRVGIVRYSDVRVEKDTMFDSEGVVGVTTLGRFEVIFGEGIVSIVRREEIEDVLRLFHISTIRESGGWEANIKDNIVEPENLVKSSLPILPCCKFSKLLHRAIPQTCQIWYAPQILSSSRRIDPSRLVRWPVHYIDMCLISQLHDPLYSQLSSSRSNSVNAPFVSSQLP
jgi:hypothetical protein